ncbi:MAG: ABA4-like family protein [Leptospiraceae bacterium]|nr:ABA4-like family protein [Leptospiraceae bacterium]
MNPDRMFKIVNIVVIIPWLLMICLPKWNITQFIISKQIFPLSLSIFYIIYLAQGFGKASGNFMSLNGLSKLFRNDNLLLAGWIHYLVFDLFVGAWEFHDSMASGISHFILIPCLLLTLMFGPVGFLVYSVLKMIL